MAKLKSTRPLHDQRFDAVNYDEGCDCCFCNMARQLAEEYNAESPLRVAIEMEAAGFNVFWNGMRQRGY